MKKKLLIVVLFVVLVIVFLFLNGTLSFETYGQNEETISKNVTTVDDLKDGCFYVWHNDSESDIATDLNGSFSSDVFRICPEGEINWEKNDFIEHTLWFTSENDYEIPTLYEGDVLVYISSTTVPFSGVEWERFADYGYTVGVSNMIGDESGHYRIENSDGKGYKGYLSKNSDAFVVNDFVNISYLFLDKIGKVPIRDNNVSEGGTVLGLSKDQKYVCEWYTGTYYQDYELTANMHAFSSLETFTTYDYEFLHSNCIEINIPEWFKTGYYYIQGAGLFRYVSDEDKGLYSGESYDENINWNDPIILYDEEGKCIYDPSTGLDYRNSTSDNNTTENTEINDESGLFEDDGDEGLEAYGLDDDEWVEAE